MGLVLLPHPHRPCLPRDVPHRAPSAVRAFSRPRMRLQRKLGTASWLCALVVAGTLCVLLDASLTEARTLSSVFTTELKGLEMAPLGPALADTVASTYPVASASSRATYVFAQATRDDALPQRISSHIT